MNSIQFIEALKKLKPSDIKLKEQGLTDKELLVFQRNWFCKPKSRIGIFENPISELVNNWNCSEAEISGISFYKSIKEDSKYAFFAELDMDRIGVNKSNNIIEMIGYEDSKINFPVQLILKNF